MKDWANSNILAIDSSGRSLILGLSFGGDRLVKSSEMVERSHGQIILKKISGLFESAGASKDELDGISVCTGPGSFTGLRIGIAAAKGLAVARGIPVVGISLLEIAAHKSCDTDRVVSVLIPLRRDEFIAADVFQGKPVEDKVRVVSTADLPMLAKDNPVACYHCRIGDLMSGFAGEDLTALIEYDGADLIQLGRDRFTAGLEAELSSLEPLYIQKSQAEIKFDARDKS
ncbi:MAG: tRNA (adenosine(37)-N6)-threonylcarbamoyltransferase complex dimerization subunit type 1 TsaB [Candidatus Zixiibacteriota bacterium]|nr:MAG: tRNA (adenosine(37)-N6)-threonylcarbamoyltransferase complex dimerization subunit type 1 TsaB [candidate division Zixibacteria bacterium]